MVLRCGCFVDFFGLVIFVKSIEAKCFTIFDINGSLITDFFLIKEKEITVNQS